MVYRNIFVLIALLLISCSAQPQLPHLTSQAVVLAFGDSLTYGTGAKREQSYPAQLARLIGREVVNGGIPGEVSAAGLKRLPQLLDDLRPELLIICHGGNDMLRKKSSRQLQDNLRAMITVAQQRGIAVVMIAVPQLGIMLSPPSFYQQLADEMGVPIETAVLSDVLIQRTLKSDPIHPNADGYRLMADALYRLMTTAGSLQINSQ